MAPGDNVTRRLYGKVTQTMSHKAKSARAKLCLPWHAGYWRWHFGTKLI